LKSILSDKIFQPTISGKSQWGPVTLGALILTVHSRFPERLNQSRQGMVDAGDTKAK
jgi:hypothetical protein